MSTPDTETTVDAFLGGRLSIEQPRRGYRAGSDPVLLAAAVPAHPGQSVLDLGCGVGTALFCLGARVPGLALTGIEKQPDYAALAGRNAGRNGLTADIHTGDVAAMPRELRQMRFDHVLTNPPYFNRNNGTASPDLARETALAESTPLLEWISNGARRLAPRGRMTVIQKADRLPDLLTAMAAHLGSLQIRPVQPRAEREATLVLVSGIKGGRALARLKPPFIMHGGHDATTDAAEFSVEACHVLTDAAPIL